MEIDLDYFLIFFRGFAGNIGDSTSPMILTSPARNPNNSSLSSLRATRPSSVIERTLSFPAFIFFMIVREYLATKSLAPKLYLRTGPHCLRAVLLWNLEQWQQAKNSNRARGARRITVAFADSRTAWSAPSGQQVSPQSSHPVMATLPFRNAGVPPAPLPFSSRHHSARSASVDSTFVASHDRSLGPRISARLLIYGSAI